MDSHLTPAVNHGSGRGGIVAMVGCLYLVQGVPVGLAFQAFPVLLRDGGASLDLIALVPLASLPWVLKVFWASMVENHWSRGLGRRRSWILPMQGALVLCLVGMALLPFTSANAPALLGLIALSSLASATQDIAADGLAAERLRGDAVASVNTLQVAGFMVGMLVGGPGVMVGIGVAGHGATLAAVAGLVVLCGLPTALWREPAPPTVAVATHASLGTFFRRLGTPSMLFLAVFATLGGAVTFALVKLILVDAGWSPEAVGFLAGTGNTLTILAGCALAAVLTKTWGPWTTLIAGAALTGIAAALWMAVAPEPARVVPALAWTLASCGGLGIGVVSVASYTVLMRFAQGGLQPATDFSVFQGIQTLGEILISSVATAVAAQAGYPAALAIGVAASVVAILLARRARNHGDTAAGAVEPSGENP